MFRITTISTGLQEECTSRDDLLSLVNEKSVWAEDRNETIHVRLEQLSEEGQILDEKTLSLPLREIVEETLSSFGLQKEKKGFSLLRLGKNQKQAETKSEVSSEAPPLSQPIDIPEKVERPEEFETSEEIPVSKPLEKKTPMTQSKPEEKVVDTVPITPATPASKPGQKKVKEKKQPSSVHVKKTEKKKTKQPITAFNPLKLLSPLLGLVALLVAIMTLHTSQQQSKKIAQLEERIALEASQGKLEVVGRFFIASYFSGKSERLGDFLSEDLLFEGVKAKSGERLQSTFYESLKKEGDMVSITFIVTTETIRDEEKTVRITLPFKEEKRSPYGYVLAEQPIVSNFSE